MAAHRAVAACGVSLHYAAALHLSGGHGFRGNGGRHVRDRTVAVVLRPAHLRAELDGVQRHRFRRLFGRRWQI